MQHCRTRFRCARYACHKWNTGAERARHALLTTPPSKIWRTFASFDLAHADSSLACAMEADHRPAGRFWTHCPYRAGLRRHLSTYLIPRWQDAVTAASSYPTARCHADLAARTDFIRHYSQRLQELQPQLPYVRRAEKTSCDLSKAPLLRRMRRRLRQCRGAHITLPSSALLLCTMRDRTYPVPFYSLADDDSL